jgi:2-polyprenyl-6-methoxyphenol hydroxylase-like FAD-dependent oxidoreductase
MECVIVGGGPTGLALACLLAQRGIGVRVLERRMAPRHHSRAIGIHPPGLAALARIGVADALIADGIRIERGRAYGEKGRLLGTVPLAPIGGAYPFVLSVPQSVTERHLETRLAELAPGALQRGVAVVKLRQDREGVHGTTVPCAGGPPVRFRADYAIGCDGGRSVVRQRAGIETDGATYPDTYVMGDFADTTDYGNDAVLHLCRAGLVEAFPLPGGRRRWVVKTHARCDTPTPEDLVAPIRARTGIVVAAESVSMLSGFGIEARCARTFVWRRFLLAGDAAHTMSPIGGQGMTVGWLDAALLAEALAAIAQGGSVRLLGAYNTRRLAAARQAISRARGNTLLGRATPLAPLRSAAIWCGVRTPLAAQLARRFTLTDRDVDPVVEFR